MNKPIKQGSKLTRIVIIFVIILLIFSAFKLQIDLNELKTQKKALNEELTLAEYERQRLENELNRITDDEYVAKVAREKLNYSDPNELVFYNDLSD